MSASLVGSEMCIRDRLLNSLAPSGAGTEILSGDYLRTAGALILVTLGAPSSTLARRAREIIDL
eukprot:14168243-Alexandrium_andersonii.AAC.1